MKVLFVSYPTCFQNPGGGEVVLLKMKQYLEKVGVQVQLFDMWKDDIGKYDVVQVFGSVKECLPVLQVAKARGVPSACFPVFWSDFHHALHFAGGFKTRLNLTARHAVKWAFPFFPSERRSILDLSDVLFPNSEMEKKSLSRLFALPEDKMRVIPNAAEKFFADATPDLFRRTYPHKEFVLSVGRIEPRKNQLNLIRAFHTLPYDLVLVGSAVAGFEDYEAQCRKEAGKNVHFLGAMDAGSPLIASAYAAARVFALPGWFETPGLAALEAGLAGCGLAVTQGGSTREYFGDLVYYLDPAKPSSIADSIRKAWSAGKNEALKTKILEHYTWEKAAQEVKTAYEALC